MQDDYSDVDMGKTEDRDDDLTTGSYHVALPDGTHQYVDYYVDGYSGYVADVTYEGEPEPYDYRPAYYNRNSRYKTSGYRPSHSKKKTRY